MVVVNWAGPIGAAGDERGLMMKVMVRSMVLAAVLATAGVGAHAATPKTSPAFADQFMAGGAAV